MLWSIPTPASSASRSAPNLAPARRARRAGTSLGDLRRYGVVPLIESTAYRLARRYARLRLFHVVELRPQELNEAALALPPGYTIRRLDAEEIRASIASFPEPPTPAFIDAALSKGDCCIAIFDGLRMVCSGWYSRQPTGLFDGLAVRFAPDAAYAYKLYTASSHRGRRLMAINQAHALRTLLPDPPRRLFSCVEAANHASRRSDAWLGARLIGVFGYWRGHGRAIGYTSARCSRKPFGVLPLQP